MLKILSLFDGISGVAQSLKENKQSIDKYYTSEIDKYAIKVQEHHFPSAIQLGDIRNWDDWQIKRPDLIVGGFPCQNLSLSNWNGGRGLDGDRSKLFWTMYCIIKKYKPKYFLVENVKMKKKYQDEISKSLGVEPIFIDSADFSAQKRQRLYWTNIKVDPWIPKNIKLQDILESGYVDRDKSYCIDANYHKGGNLNQYFNKSRRQLVFNRSDSFDDFRKLTPLEVERLQGYPDNFTNVGISNTQRYKCIGNSFNIFTVAHILKNI